MTAYYYFVASLPSLAAEGSAPLTRERFRALCSEHLTERDLRELEAVLAGGGTSAFARSLRSFELAVKNAGARARAQRRGLDAAPFVRPTREIDLGLDRAIDEAFAAPHPLERERALERARRERTRALAFAEPFGLPAVLAYAVELEMLWRAEARSKDSGRNALLQRIEQLLRDREPREELR